MPEDLISPHHDQRIVAQMGLLAALSAGARLLRHRGPLGQPLPFTFTLHHDADPAGVLLDAACVKALFNGELITLGPRPDDALAPRPLHITDAGRAACTQFIDAAYDTLAVLEAMTNTGARLHRDRHGVYALDGGTAVATLTGHVLVVLGYVAATDHIGVWELSGTGRRRTACQGARGCYRCVYSYRPLP